MRAMIVKEFRELARDRRTVAMLIGMPLLMLLIFGFAANFTVSRLDVTAVGPQATTVQATLQGAATGSTTLVVTANPSGGDKEARAALRDDKADLSIVTGGQRPVVYIDGSNLFAAQAARIVVAQAGDQVESHILYNPDLKTSWVMVPALIGLIMTFVGMVITSIGLVREREMGTLEQLAVMPIKPSAVVLGKVLPYFALACVDMVLITVLGMVIFHVPFNGNVAIFALGAVLFLFAVLGLGVFISTVSHTTGQAIQGAIMMLLPQILLSGMIFPLDAMAAGVRWIGYLLPLTYFTHISQGTMLRGADLSSLWLPLVVLAGMAVVLFGAATVRFRRSIAPPRPSQALKAPADSHPAEVGR